MDPIRYTLGLNIGITSVGWAVVRNDIRGEPMKIERLGSRVFPRGENPKDGSSPAAPRREARGSRRKTRRRQHRKDRIRQLLEEKGIMTREEISALYSKGGFEKSVYELRSDALDRALTKEEAARLLIHCAQRRGYQSISRSEEAGDRENGKVLAAIAENRRRMSEGHYRTVGEMLWKDPEFRRERPDGSLELCVRNQPGEYGLTFSRSMMEDEIRAVFQAQRNLGASWADEDLESRYLEIWGGQRNYDEGPGGDSPYGGSQIEKKLGRCTFEKDELRAPKACYTAERFRLLQTASHMTLCRQGEEPRHLTREERKTVIRLAMEISSPSYDRIRKELKLPEDVFFSTVRYTGSSARESEKGTKLKEMQFYHILKKALDSWQKGYTGGLDTDQMDEIARILTLYKSDDNRRQRLAALGLPEEAVSPLLALSPTGAAHLSLKAMKKLLPYLEQGDAYSTACVKVYGSVDGNPAKAARSSRLSMRDLEEVNSPAVIRAVSQAVKVINAVVRDYGPPEAVRMELAPELKMSFEDRGRRIVRQRKNAERNEEIRGEIRKYKKSGDPNGQDIVKYRLYEEQGGICLYSGEQLDLGRLFEPGYAEVDHIIPYSISLDDSYDNRVLVLASENRRKGCRTPYQYFGQDPDRWKRFTELAEDRIRSWRKRRNLYTREISEYQEEELRQRNLVDTQYPAGAIFHLVDQHLQFAETGIYPHGAQTVSNAITSEVRKRLGIDKIPAGGDLSHARDAAVTACISPGLIRKITDWSRRQELDGSSAPENGCLVDPDTGEVLTSEDGHPFPEPWDRFCGELEARLSGHPQEGICRLRLSTYEDDEIIPEVSVSRMPQHGVSGSAHKETIRGGKKPGYTIVRTALTDLKLDGRTGEIAGYCSPESDPLLYSALKERLTDYNGNAEEAFKEPFYKPKANGELGPLVKKVKTEKKATLSVDTGRGLADNDRMVRVDVFYVEDDGYYFIPVYVADTVKKDLPNSAAVCRRSYEDWKVMDDRDFLFSLYPGDLVHIIKEDGIRLKRNPDAAGESGFAEEILVTEGWFYFEGYVISVGALKISTRDGRYSQPGLGGKTLDLIEKYDVDVLGNISRVRLPEKRMGFGGRKKQ